MTDAHAMVHPVIRRLAHAELQRRGLADTREPIRLGDIVLLPHQCAAVRWLRPRLMRFGGALLADPPGLGKTYVALAIAAERQTVPLVIAPAALRTRWSEASRETGVEITFVSTERLSAPAALPHVTPDLVIIDEAHHLRTLTTRRHQRTAHLCAQATVLLLSATPIQNRRQDLTHLTALFHLPPTQRSARYLRRRLTLRRSLEQIRDGARNGPTAPHMPDVQHRRAPRFEPRHATAVSAITTLPTLQDELADGHRLLQLGLLHALRSSDAAARTRVHRRIAITLAVEQSAMAGVNATRETYAAWQAADGVIQLAMPQLLAPATPTTAEPSRCELVIAGARAHRHALQAMLGDLDGAGDDGRATVLRRLARWCARPVVAFTQFTATAHRLFQLLHNETGIALLTGSGARIVTGSISRAEALDRLLTPRYRTAQDAVRLLIATDVLSEGLSLAGVGTVVHLDLPWTAARLDQRVGRAARIGAPVPAVRVITMPAALPAEATDALRALLARKRRRMHDVVSALDADVQCVRLLRALGAGTPRPPNPQRWVTVRSADVTASRTLAIVRVRRDRLLVVLEGEELRAAAIGDWTALANAEVVAPQRGAIARLCRAVRAWLADQDLCTVVRHRSDHRLQARLSADESLLIGDRATRTAIAGAVSAHRRTSMHDVAPRDLFGSTRARVNVPPERWPASPRHDVQGPSQRAVREVRIIAGVEIVPRTG